jgi:3-oxoacyl-[acyl-carrier protein] reductase
VSGIRAGGSSIPYSVSKGAETMLTKCLAMALAPEVTVNAVAPGLMDTRWGHLWGDEAFERVAQAQPLKHIPTLVDIASTAVFLAKNDSMTGQSIVVDGGGFMH